MTGLPVLQGAVVGSSIAKTYFGTLNTIAPSLRRGNIYLVIYWQIIVFIQVHIMIYPRVLRSPEQYLSQFIRNSDS